MRSLCFPPIHSNSFTSLRVTIMSCETAGNHIVIDLTNGRVKKMEADSRYAYDYLGGRGIATRLFWERVSPETPAFSTQNHLVFVAGLLTGSAAPSANRTTVVTRSPQTGLLTYSTVGGFWGPELKQAGYDALVFSGKSPEPVYVWISDHRIELRDASHLWGRDTRETQRIVRRELDCKHLQLLCIGPAGENRSHLASVEHSIGSGASRAGVGAVMGDKRLKAIAVFGSGDIGVARPDEFQTLCRDIIRKAGPLIESNRKWATDAAPASVREGVYGNFDRRLPFDRSDGYFVDFEVRHKERTVSCYNCSAGCRTAIRLADGSYSFGKCQAYFAFVFASRIQDLAFSMQCFHRCERYGLDVVSTARTVAFVIDLFQNGILTTADTGGLVLGWQQAEMVLALIDSIARREGIGDLLADGVHAAAARIGRGAETRSVCLKKLEALPLHMDQPYMALRCAITDKPDPTRSESYFVSEALNASREWKTAFLKSGNFGYPRALEDLFLQDVNDPDQDYERIVPFTACDMDKNTLTDCTGLCSFWTVYETCNPISPADHLRLIACATGRHMDETEAFTIASRIGALTRAFNVMTGIRRPDDTVPSRYFQTDPAVGRSGLERRRFDRMIDAYYRLRGWNSQGIPTAVTLDALGLPDVRAALEQRDIL